MLLWYLSIPVSPARLTHSFSSLDPKAEALLRRAVRLNAVACDMGSSNRVSEADVLDELNEVWGHVRPSNQAHNEAVLFGPEWSSIVQTWIDLYIISEKSSDRYTHSPDACCDVYAWWHQALILV